MKIVSRLIAAFTLTVMTAGVFAQSITIDPVVANPGDVVTIPVNFTESMTELVDSLSFLVKFDPAADLTITVPADCDTAASVAATLKDCGSGAEPPTGYGVFIQVGAVTPLHSGSVATITVTVGAGATPGDVVDVTISEVTISPATTISTPSSSLTIATGPQPAFTGVAAGLAMTAGQGPLSPSGTLTVTNSGAATSTLTGTCNLTGPDSEISLTNGAFSVLQGAAGVVVGVSCDASAAGSFTNTLSCAHNGSNATPATYPVTCAVAAPGAAVFQSNPAAGSTIDMTPEDVPVDADVADQGVIFTNAATGSTDNSLGLACTYSGSPEISVTAPTSPIVPRGSSAATFSCNTAAVGDYTGTYSCDYTTDGGAAPTGSASYTVNCGVRAAESEIAVNPASGTLSMTVPMNGSGTTSINFSEILDEGADATIDSCSLADGSDFAIITTFPLTVPAGGSVQVVVEGTDPANGSPSASDTLTCTVTDSTGTSTGEWALQLTVQTAAIPTLSVWGMLAMFLTMLGFGGIVIRRKMSS